jgi:hypothetical protein
MGGRKYKQAFERDWNFYYQNRHKFNFTGGKAPIVIADPKGKDAKRVFHRYDSQGKMLPCKEPELLREIFACKVAVNMHLKMWADGYFDVMIPVEELMKEFVDPPQWVEDSLRNQVRKKMTRDLETRGND